MRMLGRACLFALALFLLSTGVASADNCTSPEDTQKCGAAITAAAGGAALAGGAGAGWQRKRRRYRDPVPTRPPGTEGMIWDEAEGTWRYPRPGDPEYEPPVVADTPERKTIPGACLFIYDDYKMAEARLKAMIDVLAGLRDRLAQAKELQAKNVLKANINLGLQLGPDLAGAAEMIIQGASKAIRNMATRPLVTAAAREAMQQAINEAERAAIAAEQAVPGLRNTARELDQAASDLARRATQTKQIAEEAEQLFGPLEEQLGRHEARLRELPNEATAHANLEQASSRLREVERIEQLGGEAEAATQRWWEAEQRYQPSRSQQTVLEGEHLEILETRVKIGRAQRRVEYLLDEVKEADEALRGVLQADDTPNIILPGQPRQADINTGAVRAQPPDPGNTGAVPRQPSAPAGAAEQANLARLRQELQEAQTDLAQYDVPAVEARDLEVGRERVRIRNESAALEAEWKAADTAMNEADRAYDPHRSRNLAQERSQAQGAVEAANSVVEEIGETRGAIDELGPKVQEMHMKQTTATETTQQAELAEYNAANGRTRLTEKEREAAAARQRKADAEQRMRETEAAQPPHDWLTNPDSFVDYMKLLNPHAIASELATRAARKLGEFIAKYASSGQTWEDILRILEEGKSTVARLEEELKHAEGVYTHLQESLFAHSGALGRCMTEHGGTWLGDGNVTATEIGGPNFRPAPPVVREQGGEFRLR